MSDEVEPSTAEQDAHLAADLQEFVYGTLTALVAIGGLSGSAEAPRPRDAIAVIVGVAFATTLAHAFSALIALHVRERRAVQRAEFLEEIGHSWRIVTATVPSVLMFVLAALGVFSTRTAMRLSTALAIAALIVVGVIAARRSGSSAFGVVLFVAVATTIGLSIVAIELFVHHL